MDLCYVAEGKNLNQAFDIKEDAIAVAKQKPWADGTVYLHTCKAKDFDGRSRDDGFLIFGLSKPSYCLMDLALEV